MNLFGFKPPLHDTQPYAVTLTEYHCLGGLDLTITNSLHSKCEKGHRMKIGFHNIHMFTKLIRFAMPLQQVYSNANDKTIIQADYTHQYI